MKIRKPTGFFILKKFKKLKMELIEGEKVYYTCEINVGLDEKIFAEIVKEKRNKNSKDLIVKVNGTIVSLTSNSVEIYLKRIKESGVNCSQWYSISDFERKFKVE